MGKFHRILAPGLAILTPFLDRIAYVKSLKEAALEIPSQSAITADNVTLELDGVLYTRVDDAYKARYETLYSLAYKALHCSIIRGRRAEKPRATPPEVSVPDS
jgi:regulator of protease activity HflC (stomatin/prohibitin superfamily)